MIVKVPGKLMIAGEFAVLEPKQKLVVTAVNRFVYVSIERSKQNEVTLKDFGLSHLTWEWQSNQLSFQLQDSRLDFVKHAMEVAYRYLLEQQTAVYPVSISIHSELDDETGIKYGLGSSAAVVTATVRAILTEFSADKPDDLLVFKLASIAHVRTQGNGSGADIAASTYHGVLEYTSFQAEWLLKEISEKENMTDIVDQNWIYLSIGRINFPADIQMYVAWTGKAASTKQLVAKIKQLKNTAYTSFLEKSHEAVAAILEGMKTNQSEMFLEGIKKNRQALAKLGNDANVEIETEKLHILALEAEKVNGAGKLSGAGGGDCGIAFIPKNQDVYVLYNAWRKQGITPIDVVVCE